ncbi:MAG: GldG family protein [Anaerolineales bacterium]|nr:GldG family protein [Anaerolineales bacterium]
MSEHPKKKTSYTTIALVIALVAFIVAGLVGAANLLSKIGMFPLSPEIQKGTNLAFQISLGLLIVSLATAAILDPDPVRRFFSGRQARYGSNSLILALATVGILVAVNYIVFKNPDLLNSPYDLTADKSNTLAPETLQILAELKQPVKATGFFSADSYTSDAESILGKFRDNSAGKFSYQFANPDTDPVTARNAGVTGDGKILLQMGETKEIAAYASETELARALLRLISPGSHAVYFLQGHGEISLDGSGQLSYSVVKSTLEAKNYTVGELNLLTTRAIPEDAQTVIIAGPQKPVSEDEVALLKAYMEKGGSLVVLEDPTFVTQFGAAKDPLADYLSADWGITLNNDVIVDGVNQQNPLAAVSSRANPHPITQNLTQNLVVVMPQARSLSIASSAPANVTDTWLISTEQNSWGKTDIDENSVLDFDPAKDIPGPLYLAVAAENLQTKGRVVVFGNSPFAIDQNFDVYGNGNFLINSIDWAAEQEELLNLTARPRTERIFTPPAATWQFMLLTLVIVIVIPGLVVFLGVSAWLARRKRG